MSIWQGAGFAMLAWGLGGVTGWMIGSPVPSTQHRTEVQMIYDSGTGCQYLISRTGNLTPRLDDKGRQVCRHE